MRSTLSRARASNARHYIPNSKRPISPQFPTFPSSLSQTPNDWLQVTLPKPLTHHPAPPACHLNPDFSILESLSMPLQSTSRRPFSKPSPLRASKPLSRIFDGYTERRKHPRGRPGPHRELPEQSRHRDARVGVYPRDLRVFLRKVFERDNSERRGTAVYERLKFAGSTSAMLEVLRAPRGRG